MTIRQRGPANRFVDEARTLLASLVDLVRLRIELVSHEAMAEVHRMYVSAFLLLGAAACLAFALALGVFFVIALFWDTHRFEAIGGCALVLVMAACALAILLRRRMTMSPRPFAATLAELEADIAALRGVTPE